MPVSEGETLDANNSLLLGDLEDASLPDRMIII